MSKLAIIIPALGDVQRLEDGLVSVLQHRPADAEVLVVLTRPYSDPYDLQDEVRFIQAPRRSGLVACLQMGLDASHAPLVHFLGAGREVEEDWAERAIAHFDDPRVAAVAPLTLDTLPRETAYAGVEYCWGGSRRLRSIGDRAETGDVLGPELQASFYRRTAVEAVGGLSVEVGDELADVELAITLQQAGFHARFEPASQIHLPNDFGPQHGPFRRGLYAERMFWRNAPAHGWVRSLAAHPWTLATGSLSSGLLGMAPHLLGRLLGGCQWSRRRAQHQLLAELRQNPPVVSPHQEDADANRRIDASHPHAEPHTRQLDRAPRHAA